MAAPLPASDPDRLRTCTLDFGDRRLYSPALIQQTVHNRPGAA